MGGEPTPVAPPQQTSEAGGRAQPVPAAPPRPARDPAAARNWIWIVVAVVVLVILAWLILSILPAGRDGEPGRSDALPTPVEEGGLPDGSLAEGEGLGVPPPRLDEVAVDGAAEEVVIEELDGGQASAPPRPDAADANNGRMTPGEAVGVLLGWVARNDHYGVPGGCISARNQGYSNRGYTIELYARGCRGRSDGLLGRWRVDTLTSRVYEQKPDGRYLDP